MDKADRKILDIQKVLLGSFCVVFPSLETISHFCLHVLYWPLSKFKLKVSKLSVTVAIEQGTCFLACCLLVLCLKTLQHEDAWYGVLLSLPLQEVLGI